MVENPNSKSMPSTPRYNLLKAQFFRMSSLYSPTTERELWRTIPPSCMMSIFSCSVRISLTCSDADTTVSRPIGTMLRARAWTVVPEAKMMESLVVMSLAASRPISVFCSVKSFSFSFTDRLLVKGLSIMARPWLR